MKNMLIKADLSDPYYSCFFNLHHTKEKKFAYNFLIKLADSDSIPGKVKLEIVIQHSFPAQRSTTKSCKQCHPRW